MPADPQSAEPVAWRELLTPHIARFEAAYVSGGDAVYNPIGSQAMATLLSGIADKLDAAVAVLQRERDEARGDLAVCKGLLDLATQDRKDWQHKAESAFAGLDAEGAAHWAAVDRAKAAEASLAKAEARIEELEAALRSFADGSVDVSGTAIIVGYPAARQAHEIGRSALSSINKEPSHGT